MPTAFAIIEAVQCVASFRARTTLVISRHSVPPQGNFEPFRRSQFPDLIDCLPSQILSGFAQGIFGRFRSEAEMGWAAEPGASVENDPQRLFVAKPRCDAAKLPDCKNRR
jgi:hypothetical protein